jgi:uncharacterized protein with HEPN domain
MTKDPNILLKHILESIDILESYIKDLSKDEYLQSVAIQDSTERRLQVIGEAVSQLPQSFKDKHPNLAWAKIAALRNRLVHEYFDVDHVLVWEILSNHVPKFKLQVQKLLGEKS